MRSRPCSSTRVSSSPSALRPTALPGFEHLGHIGALFQGSDAWLATNYETNEVWVKGKKVDDFPRPAPTIPDSPGHVREFLDAVKSRNLETTCNMRYGYRADQAGPAVEHLVPHGTPAALERGGGAHHRRQGREPSADPPLPQGLPTLSRRVQEHLCQRALPDPRDACGR